MLKVKKKLQKLEDLRIVRENQIATTSISDHVKFFDNQAKEHQDSARRWLKATIWMAIGFVSYCYHVMAFNKTYWR